MSESGADDSMAASGRSDGGYVHREDGEPGSRSAGKPDPQSGSDPEFGRSGWILVAMIAVAFLVVPGAILLLPSAQGLISALGLTLRDAYLTLPLIPAFVLGALAVWAAIRSQAQ